MTGFEPDNKCNKHTGDFSCLQDVLKEHLVKHGMDSIAYLKNQR